MKTKVCIVQPTPSYVEMFKKLGYEVVDKLKDCELICFTGGADVSPRLYKESQHPHTHCDPHRDNAELAIYHIAAAKKIPMVGICRGGQFLHVMNGGKMWQHVNNHGVSAGHILIDVDTDMDYTVTSTHHQMMRYSGSGELVAIAAESSFKETMGAHGMISNIEETEDVEVLWYAATNCLCFQPHPEFVGATETFGYFSTLLKRYLRN